MNVNKVFDNDGWFYLRIVSRGRVPCRSGTVRGTTQCVAPILVIVSTTISSVSFTKSINTFDLLIQVSYEETISGIDFLNLGERVTVYFKALCGN